MYLYIFSSGEVVQSEEPPTGAYLDELLSGNLQVFCFDTEMNQFFSFEDSGALAPVPEGLP